MKFEYQELLVIYLDILLQRQLKQRLILKKVFHNIFLTHRDDDGSILIYLCA